MFVSNKCKEPQKSGADPAFLRLKYSQIVLKMTRRCDRRAEETRATSTLSERRPQRSQSIYHNRLQMGRLAGRTSILLARTIPVLPKIFCAAGKSAACAAFHLSATAGGILLPQLIHCPFPTFRFAESTYSGQPICQS